MLPEKILKLRKKKGLTQEELGILIGVTKQTISKYEGNIKPPSRKALQKLADIFQVTTDYLLGRSELPNTDAQKDAELTKTAKEILERINTLPEDRQKKAWEHLEMFVNYEMVKKNV
nr:helix-turn-helix transcriptional regulator [Bacillus cereus]